LIINMFDDESAATGGCQFFKKAYLSISKNNIS
jgi:hypothetical protein